jgi:hypothetical protein
MAGVRFPAEAIFFLISIASRAALSGPPNLLSNGYQDLYPLGLGSRFETLTTHYHPGPRSRLMELYLHLRICLHGIRLK